VRNGDPRDSVPLGDLVGRDARMIEIYKVIGQVAATRANVLIRGESGTGKELIAHAIHLHSADAAEPFVPVNCTALPATLLESELFGHVRGSFTGAQSDRRGRFALAGRGSIFLDEIGDTSPEFQTKLLRVLQERQFYPVGADRPEKTEARVIAATHRNLESMVESGEFRGDLYYRLRVVEIRVPPLRERPLDLPLLAQALVRRASNALGCPVPVLAADALAALARHDWPGNVRELENCLTRAIVVSGGNVIHAEDLTLGEGRAAAGAAPLGTLDEWEREHVERVLAATGGQKAQAARVLGVSRPRLDRLLKKHGLD
jgi:transcriptional regulator with GAF, ATPase, and Fis domain